MNNDIRIHSTPYGVTHDNTFSFIHHRGDHTQISFTAPQQFHFNHHDNTQITACWLKPQRLVHRSFWDANSFTSCPFSSEQELIFINFEEAYFVRTAWKIKQIYISYMQLNCKLNHNQQYKQWYFREKNLSILLFSKIWHVDSWLILMRRTKVCTKNNHSIEWLGNNCDTSLILMEIHITCSRRQFCFWIKEDLQSICMFLLWWLDYTTFSLAVTSPPLSRNCSALMCPSTNNHYSLQNDIQFNKNKVTNKNSEDVASISVADLTCMKSYPFCSI